MKKIIDNEGRLFGKISVIDLAVVLIVAVMAVALYVKNNRLDASSTSSDANTTIYFVAVSGQVSNYNADAIKVGDKVYDKDRSSGGAIGEIVDIETSPSSLVLGNLEGEFVDTPNDEAKSMRVTVKCTGSISGGSFSINRVYHLGVNANRNFYTPYAVLNGFCVTEIYGENAS